MTALTDLLSALQELNRKAGFNVWAGIEVLHAESGAVVIGMPWRIEAGQYTGFLHAGVIAALIDTACGFAAATQAGLSLLAVHFSVNCRRPASGERFEAHASVVKAGRNQFFTRCELYAFAGQGRSLIATGETLLNVVATS